MSFWSSANLKPARQYRFKLGPSGITWWYANSVTLPSFDVNTVELLLVNQKFKYPGVPTWNNVEINIVDVADSVQQVKKMLATRNFNITPSGSAPGVQVDGIAKVADASIREAGIEKIASGIKNEIQVFKDKIAAEEKKANTSLTDVTRYQNRKKIREFEDAAKQRQKILEQGLDAEMAQANDMIIEQLDDNGKTFRKWTLVNSFITSVNYGELNYSSDDFVTLDISVTYDYAIIE